MSSNMFCSLDKRPPIFLAQKSYCEDKRCQHASKSVRKRWSIDVKIDCYEKKTFQGWNVNHPKSWENTEKYSDYIYGNALQDGLKIKRVLTFFQLQTCILKAIFFLELCFKCDENLQFSGVKTVKGNFPPLETYVARKWEEIFTFLFWMQRKKLKVFSSKFSLENQVTSFFRTFRLHFSWLF